MSGLASNDAAVHLAEIPSQDGPVAPSTEPGGRRGRRVASRRRVPTASLVEACTWFVATAGRPAAIGALRDAAAVFAGTAGTTITA